MPEPSPKTMGWLSINLCMHDACGMARTLPLNSLTAGLYIGVVRRKLNGWAERIANEAF